MLVFLGREPTFLDELGTLIGACAAASPQDSRQYAQDFCAFIRVVREAVPYLVIGDVCSSSVGPDALFDETRRILRVEYRDTGGLHAEDKEAPLAAHVAWNVLHALPYAVAPHHVGAFAEALLRVFPCEKCRQHALDESTKQGVHMLKACETSEDAVLEMMRFHNTVTRNVEKHVVHTGVRRLAKQLFLDFERAVDVGKVSRRDALIFLGLLYRYRG